MSERPLLLLIVASGLAWLFAGCSGCTGPEPEVWPCAGDDWVAAAESGTAVFVLEDGSELGDGSWDAPLATLEQGRDALRADPSLSTLLVGPGQWTEGLALDAQDDGISVIGCGVEETQLAVPWTAQTPTFHLDGASAVTIQDLMVWGGSNAVFVQEGSGVTLRGIAVEEVFTSAVYLLGTEAALLEDVAITGTQARTTPVDPPDYLGIGLIAHSADVDVVESVVEDSVGLGVFATAPVDDYSSSLLLNGVQVEGTVAASGDVAWGRGVHVQYLAETTLIQCGLIGNSDAGMITARIPDLTLTSTTFGETVAGDVDGNPTGDGLVITSLSLDPAEVGDFTATLTDVQVTDNARTGGLFEGVTVEFVGDLSTASGNADEGWGEQYAADVTGNEEVVDLQDSLEIDRVPVELPDLLAR